MKPYSDDYHIVYGLHSGWPLCCVFNREETGEGGECPKCKEAGEYWEMHRCHENIPACESYIELITEGIVSRIRKWAEDGLEEISVFNSRFPSTQAEVVNTLMAHGYVYDRDSEVAPALVVGVDSEGPLPKTFYVYRKES